MDEDAPRCVALLPDECDCGLERAVQLGKLLLCTGIWSSATPFRSKMRRCGFSVGVTFMIAATLRSRRKSRECAAASLPRSRFGRMASATGVVGSSAVEHTIMSCRLVALHSCTAQV